MKVSHPKLLITKKALQGRDVVKKIVPFLEFVALHAFEASIAAILIAVLLGSITIAQYRRPVSQELPARERGIRFSEELYQQVLGELKKRKQAFEEVDKKEYPNLFVPREGAEERGLRIDEMRNDR